VVGILATAQPSHATYFRDIGWNHSTKRRFEVAASLQSSGMLGVCVAQGDLVECFRGRSLKGAKGDHPETEFEGYDRDMRNIS
jgi:hypothetical protein